jgi:hypothetical protein
VPGRCPATVAGSARRTDERPAPSTADTTTTRSGTDRDTGTAHGVALLACPFVAPLSERRIHRLEAAVRSGDVGGFRRELKRCLHLARRMAPDDLTASITALVPLLDGLGGVYTRLAVFAGACVELGGSPLPLAEVLPAQAAQALEYCAAFPDTWARAGGGRPLPDRDARPRFGEVHDVLVDGGIPDGTALRLALSWYDLPHWLDPLVPAMAQRDFRAAMGSRDRIREASTALADQVPRARWVSGLSRVLDDEPLVVLDPAGGRGYRLTMSGIGDNAQLHTLLADRLIGDPGRGLIAGERPRASWVAAATDGRPRVRTIRRFRLFDGHGSYLSPQGWPDAIRPLDGVRVLVAHPPVGTAGWTGGRVFEHMRPTLSLDAVLEPAQAAPWFDRVAPARENDDLLGGSRT